MTCLTLACHAMATRFELVAYGERESALRAAGEEALGEIERLETQLSLFRPSSEIACVNARAAHSPVRVSPPVFALLDHARRLHAETAGAFDITIAPLLRCWGFLGGSGHSADPAAVAAARQIVGMHLVELDPVNLTVRFARPGVMLDLGAIGKGYAIEQAALLLREAGITSALLHGGTSTACAIGAPPGRPAWKLAVESPALALRDTPPHAGESPIPAALASSADTPFALATVELRDQSLSVSAVWGKCFRSGEQLLGHIIDPRTGHPASDAVLAAVVTDSATETDALSTALLVGGASGHGQLRKLRPQIRTLLVTQGPAGYSVAALPEAGWHQIACLFEKNHRRD